MSGLREEIKDHVRLHRFPPDGSSSPLSPPLTSPSFLSFSYPHPSLLAPLLLLFLPYHVTLSPSPPLPPPPSCLNHVRKQMKESQGVNILSFVIRETTWRDERKRSCPSKCVLVCVCVCVRVCVRVCVCVCVWSSGESFGSASTDSHCVRGPERLKAVQTFAAVPTSFPARNTKFMSLKLSPHDAVFQKLWLQLKGVFFEVA